MWFLHPIPNTSTTNVKKIVQVKNPNFEVDNLMLKIELSHIEAIKIMT